MAALDQGVVGEICKHYRQAKRPRVQATYKLIVKSNRSHKTQITGLEIFISLLSTPP